MNDTMIPQTRPINTQCTAYHFGQADAQRGEPCDPEMLFIRRRDQIAYAAGYAAVAGPTLTTNYFLVDLVIPVMPTASAA